MRDSSRSAVWTKEVYFCSTTLFRKPEITIHSDRASKFSLNKRVIMLWLLLYWDFTRVWISFISTPLCHTCINLCKTLCQLYSMCVRMNDKGRSLPQLEQSNVKKNICLWYVHVYSSVKITEKLPNKKTTECDFVVDVLMRFK